MSVSKPVVTPRDHSRPRPHDLPASAAEVARALAQLDGRRRVAGGRGAARVA